jgi:hypothetical protein
MAEGPAPTLRARNESRGLAQAEAAVASKPFDEFPVVEISPPIRTGVRHGMNRSGLWPMSTGVCKMLRGG